LPIFYLQRWIGKTKKVIRPKSHPFAFCSGHDAEVQSYRAAPKNLPIEIMHTLAAHQSLTVVRSDATDPAKPARKGKMDRINLERLPSRFSFSPCFSPIILFPVDGLVSRRFSGSMTQKGPINNGEFVMIHEMPFAEVLEAADHLSHDEQQELIAILNRRLAQAARKRLAAEVQEARQEFTEGRCLPVTPDELMREIMK
jgi:hypothetical protein